MNISDECPEYFKAVMNGVEIPTDLTPEKFLKRNIRQNPLRFSYSGANYNNYRINYQIDQQAISQRKWVAVPSASKDLVKAIYDLANAIFKAFKGDFKGCLLNMYRFGRDVEEAYGWIVTLFDDVLGTYLVQESLFHKECYSYSERIPKDNGYFWVNNAKVPYALEARKITLEAFLKMTPEVREEKIEMFELEKVIANFGGEGAFLNKLAQANPKALALVTLFDLKLEESKEDKIPYAIMTDPDFKALTFHQIIEANAKQRKIISERLKHFVDETASYELPEDIMSIALVQFSRLSGSFINERIGLIPSFIFSFLTDAQISEVDFQIASDSQVNSLFSGFTNDEEITHRLDFLSSISQLQAVLEKLSSRLLGLIPNEQLPHLDLSGLNQQALNEGVFGGLFDDKKAERLGCLLSSQLQSILANLSESRLQLIPKAQLPHLDLSGLSRQALNEGVFGGLFDDEKAERLGCLLSSQLQSILANLSESRLHLIPKAQLPHLDLSGLSRQALNEGVFGGVFDDEKAARLGCLLSSQLQSILAKLSESRLKLIPKAQLPHLDLSGLSSKALNDGVFGGVFDDEKAARLDGITLLQLDAIYGSLSHSNLSLISGEKRQALNALRSAANA